MSFCDDGLEQAFPRCQGWGPRQLGRGRRAEGVAHGWARGFRGLWGPVLPLPAPRISRPEREDVKGPVGRVEGCASQPEAGAPLPVRTETQRPDLQGLGGAGSLQACHPTFAGLGA